MIRYLRILDKLDIEVFIYIGGNGILWIQSRNYRIMPLYSVMQSVSLDVRRRLINDLALTDHTPGYGSAAKYIGTSMKEIIRDSFCLEYEKGVVSIVEIMGRNAGWLTERLHCQREKTAKDRILSILRGTPI